MLEQGDNLTPLLGKQYDKTDRMLHPRIFQEIQNKIGKQFTLDACANPTGNNALCQKYCSIHNSFLEYNCKGHTVWMNPPFIRITIKLMILHYLYCKQEDPYKTSACILIPDWTIPSVSAYLQDMKIIRTFPANKPVMTVPATSNNNCKMERLMFEIGLPFDMVLFYDPCKEKQEDAETQEVADIPISMVQDTTGLLVHCFISKTTPVVAHI